MADSSFGLKIGLEGELKNAGFNPLEDISRKAGKSIGEF